MKSLLFSMFFYFSCTCLFSQQIQWEIRASMPERVTNNAVISAEVSGQSYVYSFAGLDSTKACGASHLRSFKYDPGADNWTTLPDLPDPNGGKIAAGASFLNGLIYIVGGYHVSNTCQEISSAKVHIFDPQTDSYLPDGTDIPVPIDDHVQAVWRDSLIFVVTGWSNTTNVTNVQIYNPSSDTWTAGTSVPFLNDWRVFGASGVIIGDTIYYSGGASPSCNFSTCFPPTAFFRKGIIDPDDPASITWEGADNPLAQGYRMGAGVFQNKPFWLGGSFLTYNFDGIDYNGTGGVSPLTYMTYLDVDGSLQQISGQTPRVMDLRGLGQISDNAFVIAGGMSEDQFVSDSTFVVTISQLTSVLTPQVQDLTVFPNPAAEVLQVPIPSGTYQVFNSVGQVKSSGQFEEGQIPLVRLSDGLYYLSLKTTNKAYRATFIKRH